MATQTEAPSIPLVAKHHGGEWEGIETFAYKDTPGSFEFVTRKELNRGSDTRFDVRYFEVGPGGYTSFERHDHEHLVVVIRGKGTVRLGDEFTDVDLNDLVRVPGQTPHQFRCRGEEPFGILCVVDRERDRPVLMDPVAEAARQRNVAAAQTS